MRVFITCDSYFTSGIGEIVDSIGGSTLKHFSAKDYGTGLLGLVVVLMCQDPAYNLKRRIRLSKKDKKLYMDIMLDLPFMVSATPNERQREVVQRLYDEVPNILAKYKIEDFDKVGFIEDFHSWIDNMGWK